MARWNQDLYKRALDTAATLHGDQKIPGSTLPYVVHVAKVAAEVLWAAAQDPALDADLALACALLHDTVEDAGASPQALAAEFGQAVADGVLALTKRDALPKAERMPDSLLRIRAQPRAVWAVKLADRITNLESPPAHWPLEKRRAYRVEATAILEGLRGGCAVLEARLLQKIALYERCCLD